MGEFVHVTAVRANVARVAAVLVTYAGKYGVETVQPEAGETEHRDAAYLC